MVERDGHIHALDVSVVNRIAAGEVVQRPASALKELIENALDAGATQINVILKSGGMKMLSVQDNGKGIHQDDLPILCHRFTTSKIMTFDDLKEIQTFGFRGEALCSISHVSKLTILTKRSTDACATRARYVDGDLVEHLPVAGVDGTLVLSEDMFYNAPLRLSALKSHTDEHSHCVKIITKYAVHNSHVGFSLKKQGQSRADVQSSPKVSKLETIRLLYGNIISRELLELKWEGPAILGKPTVEGYISNSVFHSKHMQLIIFINNRLVKCNSIKKVIEAVYQQLLPKHTFPFIYLSLLMPGHFVDVNVHPTKSEVHFLYEAEISDLLRVQIESTLQQSNHSQTFYTQTAIRLTSNIPQQLGKKSPRSCEKTYKSSHELENSHAMETDFVQEKESLNEKSKILPHKLIRTNSRDSIGLLEAYLSHPEKNILDTRKASISSNSLRRNLPKSIESLIAEIELESDEFFQQLFKDFVYVGCIDYNLILIQHSTKLYLVHIKQCSLTFMYERVLKNFGQTKVIKLEPSIPIKDMALLALDSPESNWNEEDGEKEAIAEYLVKFLKSKKELLRDGFGITVTDDGLISTLPSLVQGYEPPLLRLPFFLLRLGTEIEWGDEQECLFGIASELASFFQLHEEELYHAGVEGKKVPKVEWVIQHILLPAMKSEFHVPKKFRHSGVISQVASLEKLYKIFERC